MSRKLTGLFMSYLVLLIGLTPLPALATIEWIFTPSCSAPPCANDSGGFKTFLGTDASGSGTGPSVAVGSWGSTANAASIPKVTTTNPSPQVKSNPITNVIPKPIVNAKPNPVSNANPGGLPPFLPPLGEGPFDPTVFIFCKAPADVAAPDGEICAKEEEIALSEISLWQSSEGVWQDISVLAYTGPGTPDVTGLNSTATAQDLIANGWELIGNYKTASGPQPINSNGVSSSHWIVSPYNPALCGNGSGSCQPDSLNYVAGLKGNSAPTNVALAAIPTPGTLLLLAGGLPLIRRMRSSRTKRNLG